MLLALAVACISSGFTVFEVAVLTLLQSLA